MSLMLVNRVVLLVFCINYKNSIDVLNSRKVSAIVKHKAIKI